MWILFLTIAMAPAYEPVTKQAKYLEEKDCKRALSVAMDRVADDGIILVGRCTREASRPSSMPSQPKPR